MNQGVPGSNHDSSARASPSAESLRHWGWQPRRSWTKREKPAWLATLAGNPKRTGAIRVGLEADFVILGANPLTGLDALKDIRVIVDDGEVGSLGESNPRFCAFQ
jgi:hypothetical protein